MARKRNADPVTSNGIAPRRENGRIWSRIRQKRLVETPEERVRQEYLVRLVDEYGFQPDQIAEEEELTGRGSGHARADFVVWRTAQDKTDGKSPLIIVECKSDNVTIQAADYGQGDNYARLTNAPFFVTHNARETRFWRVKKDRMPGYIEEIENIPHADASDKEIEELIARLKVFKEEEFAQLLHQCHNVIRNREKRDPAAAFDEIAKVLFVKVWVEREMRRKRQRQNLFTAEWLDSQLGDNPLDLLFQQTKEFYETDRIFEGDERISLKPATGREIVRLLERYNLSDTSEDIKGIAFERFLGRTFRGEIGQFFTPRSIVEFMIRMMEPKEGDIICDPASGSGGFLIRFFELVREQILADADRQYQAYKGELETKKYSAKKKAELLRAKFDELQATLDPAAEGSRVWALANRRIFGTDANDRMARTSKMNMIMHGDGHGGVHHHDGFINVNGIFEQRFDIVLTNPPFGANVEPSDVILESDVAVSNDEFRRYSREYGDLYKDAQARAQAAKGKPIAALFDLPKGEKNKVKTEILFIERCLALLKPGGRLGIVLPEGIFNNPSLAYVRAFCEDRAYIRAVVSLPQETFYSSGASVKASLLFMQKFTEEEKARYDAEAEKAHAETEAKYAPEIEAETQRLETLIAEAKQSRKKNGKQGSTGVPPVGTHGRDAHATLKELQAELRTYLKTMADRQAAEARALLKRRFDYPVFLYEAEKVGITATGEDDFNELYPNPRVPLAKESGTGFQPVNHGQDAHATPIKTALDLYRAFQREPELFFV
ncbi:N-6 DNA methylase [Candidatus Sumerlaeota bacterium]|nr:N-6 DNA methylase [Candidatus Sumerlaeota bacterium]